MAKIASYDYWNSIIYRRNLPDDGLAGFEENVQSLAAAGVINDETQFIVNLEDWRFSTDSDNSLRLNQEQNQLAMNLLKFSVASQIPPD